jgi:hypothetical protein
MRVLFFFGAGKTEEAFSVKTLLTGLLLGLYCLGAATASQAGPVTFRFEATLKALPPFNDDLGLPFVLQEGKVIQGRFSFDANLGIPMPDTNAAIGFMPYAMSFRIDGLPVEIQNYQAIAIDESVIIDNETYSGPAEFLSAECYPSIPSCAPGIISTINGPALIYGGLDFAGIPEIMLTPSFGNDPDVWNAFQLRRNLQIVFVSNDGLNSAGFEALVGEFFVLPEPSSFCLVIACAVVSVSLFRHR